MTQIKRMNTNNLNQNQGLSNSIHTGNTDCLVQRGDFVTFWEDNFLSSLKIPRPYINIAGRCLECEKLCPLSVNSLSQKAKSINVRTQNNGINKQMPRKEIASISIYGNGDVITFPDLFFEV